MNTRRHTKLLHEGDYAAEVEVELTDADGEWGPYLSLEDALKLDSVREALRSGGPRRPFIIASKARPGARRRARGDS